MVLDFDFFLLKDDKVIQAMADMVQDIVDKNEDVVVWSMTSFLHFKISHY